VSEAKCWPVGHLDEHSARNCLLGDFDQCVVIAAGHCLPQVNRNFFANDGRHLQVIAHQAGQRFEASLDDLPD
jgi:hypothetical protein